MKPSQWTIRAITGFMVFEDFMQYRIPIRSISVTSVSHNAMVASVEIHPNRWLRQLNKSLAVSLWCRYIDNNSCMEKDYLIMTGSVTGVEIIKTNSLDRYVLNLIDNRKFVADLPTKYLDLIQPAIEGEPTGYSIEDMFADLQFYNIDGKFAESTTPNVFTTSYQITSAEARLFMAAWKGDTFKGYINKLFEPMAHKTSWEPYYWNHNRKRRIIDSHVVYDNNAYQAKYAGEVAAATINHYVNASIVGRNKHNHGALNEHLTYDEVFSRLSELGYIYVSQPFPTFRAKGDEITLSSSNQDYRGGGVQRFLSEYHNQEIYSLTPREKWVSKTWDANHKATIELDTSYRDIAAVRVGTESESASVYEIAIDQVEYVAILCGPKDTYNYADYEPYLLDTQTKPIPGERDAQITQFAIMPKLYGTVPPKVNWFFLNEKMTFTCRLSEPPITQLKYRLILNGSTNTAYACSYPLGQSIEYTNMTQTMVTNPDGSVELVEPEDWTKGPAYTVLDKGFPWDSSILSYPSDIAQTKKGQLSTKQEGMIFDLTGLGRLKYGGEVGDKNTEFRLYAPISGYIYNPGNKSGVIAVLSLGYALTPDINTANQAGKSSEDRWKATWAVVFNNVQPGSCPFADGAYAPQDAYIGYSGDKGDGVRIDLKEYVHSRLHANIWAKVRDASYKIGDKPWFLDWSRYQATHWEIKEFKTKYPAYFLGSTITATYQYLYFPAILLWQQPQYFTNAYANPACIQTSAPNRVTVVGEPEYTPQLRREREGYEYNEPETANTGTIQGTVGDGGGQTLCSPSDGQTPIPYRKEHTLRNPEKIAAKPAFTKSDCVIKLNPANGMWCSWYGGSGKSDGLIGNATAHAIKRKKNPGADPDDNRPNRFTNRDMTCAVWDKSLANKWLIVQNDWEGHSGYGNTIRVYGDDAGDNDVWMSAIKPGLAKSNQMPSRDIIGTAPRYIDLSKTAFSLLANGNTSMGVCKVKIWIAKDQSGVPYYEPDQKQFDKSAPWTFPSDSLPGRGKLYNTPTPTGTTSEYGGQIKLSAKIGYAAEEAYYGLKRDIYTGDAVEEIERTTHLIAENVKGWQNIMKAKVRNDYWEMRTGQNGARLTIPGLRMYAAVGFPALIYDNRNEGMYYGFVDEISHRIDNRDGNAYTEIVLSNVVTIDDIKDAATLIPGPEELWLAGTGNTLAKLNKLHEVVLGPGNEISEEDVDGLNIIDLRGTGLGEQLGSRIDREYRRRLTTIYEYMRYYYLTTKPTLSQCFHIYNHEVLTTKYKYGQWLQNSNWDIITNYAREIYRPNEVAYNKLIEEMRINRRANDNQPAGQGDIPTNDTEPINTDNEDQNTSNAETNIESADSFLDVYTGDSIMLTGPPADTEGNVAVSVKDATTPGVPSSTKCILPVAKYSVTSEFGMRKGRPHKGIDLAAKSGTEIMAVMDGLVIFSDTMRGYGNVVILEHLDNVTTIYAHNERNLVKVHDKVKQGQTIAKMGSTGYSTGPHVHFEYRVKGTAIDPRKVLPGLPAKKK